METLSRDEFAAALRKGQGRAMLHVRQYGIDYVADLVLEACLHNQVYDQQIGAVRGDWLFSMFSDTPHLPHFRQAILAAMEQETGIQNLIQLCCLTREMAEHGDNIAKQNLRDFVMKNASRRDGADWIGVNDWLDLEGPQGLIGLAQVYGQRLLDNPDDSVYDNLLDDRPSQFRDLLEQHGQADPRIKIYYDYLKDRIDRLAGLSPVNLDKTRQERRQSARKEYTLETILQDAQNKVGKYFMRYVQFGRYATPEELVVIYQHLLEEKDVDVQIRLLWIFRRAQLPQLDAVLFKWANGENQESRTAAINALAQVSDELVHQLAYQKVDARNLLGGDNDVLDLFRLNYTHHDADRITAALLDLRPNPEDAHSLGYSIRGLVEQHNDPALTPALLWVYENTPCGFCRYQVVDLLYQFGNLNPDLQYECLFDAEDDLREFVAGLPKE